MKCEHSSQYHILRHRAAYRFTSVFVSLMGYKSSLILLYSRAMRLTQLHGLRQGIALAVALEPGTDLDTLLRIDQRTLWCRGQQWNRASTLPKTLRPPHMRSGMPAVVCATRSVSGTCPSFYLNTAGEFVVEHTRMLTDIEPDAVSGDIELCSLAIDRISVNYGARVTAAEWTALLALLVTA